jgi:TrmH family RNA methyltransferase
VLNTDHLRIILVRPQSPGNIGAVARAMQNMGLQRLVLVAPERFPHPEARMMACDAVGLLHQARIVPTLAEAIASCHWLVGTSARRRQYRKPPLSPGALAQKLPALCQQYHVGIVFGPEDAGLTSDELDLCHDLLVIPTAPHATSLNLAQAVMVVCYAVAQQHVPPAPASSVPPLAPVADVEAMYQHLQAAFNVYGFPGPFAVERVLIGLRRILERTGLERRDVALLRGVARQLGWALRHPPQPEASTEPEKV